MQSLSRLRLGFNLYCNSNRISKMSRKITFLPPQYFNFSLSFSDSQTLSIAATSMWSTSQNILSSTSHKPCCLYFSSIECHHPNPPPFAPSMNTLFLSHSRALKLGAQPITPIVLGNYLAYIDHQRGVHVFTLRLLHLYHPSPSDPLPIISSSQATSPSTISSPPHG